MKLFYSVISQAGQSQANPQYSLGGYCSATPVVSGELNALFSVVSIQALEKNTKYYVLIILKNTFDYTVDDAKVWFTEPGPNQCRFRISPVLPNLRGEFEAIVNSFAKPMYADFKDATGETNAIPLPILKPDEMVGLWLERSINQESEEIANRTNCEFLLGRYDAKQEFDKEETSQLNIAFNE